MPGTARPYASGEWTCRRLAAELETRGLTSRPGPKTASKPVTDKQLQRLLCHPYYMVLVRCRGAIYSGRHLPLIRAETWRRVQDLLEANHLAGEKQRVHHHYLKGSLFCGCCGARLIVNYARGRGGV